MNTSAKRKLKSIIREIILSSPTKRRRIVEGTERSLSKILDGYLEAALWASEEELDGNFTISDIGPDQKRSAMDDIKKFISYIGANWDQVTDQYDQIGHDLWLSRNGHGAGFFDADYLNDTQQETWQSAAERLRERELVVGDDGNLYFERA